MTKWLKQEYCSLDPGNSEACLSAHFLKISRLLKKFMENVYHEKTMQGFNFFVSKYTSLNSTFQKLSKSLYRLLDQMKYNLPKVEQRKFQENNSHVGRDKIKVKEPVTFPLWGLFTFTSPFAKTS